MRQRRAPLWIWISLSCVFGLLMAAAGLVEFARRDVRKMGNAMLAFESPGVPRNLNVRFGAQASQVSLATAWDHYIHRDGRSRRLALTFTIFDEAGKPMAYWFWRPCKSENGLAAL